MKNFIARQMESGKKVKGESGFIPISVHCSCNGCDTHQSLYAPATITGIKMDGCNTTLTVKLDFDHFIADDGTEQKPITIAPENFYQTVEEIQTRTNYLRKKELFDNAISSVECRRYGSNLVSTRRNNLIDLYNRSTDAARAIIDGELEELGTTLKKVDTAKFKKFATVLAEPIYFPEGMPKSEDDEDYDD